MIGSTDSHTGAGHGRRGELLRQALRLGARPGALGALVHGKIGDASTTGWRDGGVRPTPPSGRRRTPARRSSTPWSASETYATTGPRMSGAVLRRLGFRPSPTHRARNPPHRGLHQGRAHGRRPAARPDGLGRLRRRSWSRAARSRSAPTSTASRSSRAGWTPSGKLHEKVYDVAWSGDRQPGADGKLPPVGNTVDVAQGDLDQHIGAPS